MTQDFFSIGHIVSLILAIGIIVGLYFALKKASDRAKITVLGILSFAGIGAIIYNLIVWNSPLEYLPLHLCSLGALFALVINVSVSSVEILSWTFVFYYFPHVLELGIPILMFLLGLAKKDVKCILSTVGITIGAYTIIHLINLWINSYAIKNNIVDWAGNVIKVNYMYSIYPDNPLLNLFYSIIPHQYWYMYLAVLVVILYLGLIYLKDIIALINNKRNATVQVAFFMLVNFTNCIDITVLIMLK